MSCSDPHVASRESGGNFCVICVCLAPRRGLCWSPLSGFLRGVAVYWVPCWIAGPTSLNQYQMSTLRPLEAETQRIPTPWAETKQREQVSKPSPDLTFEGGLGDST